MKELTGIAANIGKLQRQPDGQYRVYCAACGHGMISGERVTRRQARGALVRMEWAEKKGLWRCAACSDRQEKGVVTNG